MAQGTNGFEIERRPSHDGALHCVICLRSDPKADHEWCPAASSLLCDDCCSSLLQGDIARMFSLVADSGSVVTLEDLFRTCAECPRAHRHAREHLLDDAGDTDSPPC